MKKISTLTKFALVLLPLMAVMACTMQSPTRPQPRFVYKDYPPTVLGVATIQVVQEYNMPSQDPHIEHLMPQPLPFAVADWARSRFQAGGADGNLIITIKNASITDKALPTTEGVKGWFTVDQAQRYDGKIAVEFRIDGTVKGSGGSGMVDVNRGQSIAESASIQERDKTWTRMEEAMISDLDSNTQKMLQNRLPFLLK